jgi:hypothetical protein
MELSDWVAEVSNSDFIWYVKRLSGNDTLANGSHQAGPYIPKDFLFDVFPLLNRKEIKNPDLWFDLYVDSHTDCRRIRAIWYNNKFHGNPKRGRDEARLTNFGGQDSPLLDPESTGALSVFAFELDGNREAVSCHVWVCRRKTEEDLIENRIGPVEPGAGKVWSSDEVEKQRQTERQTDRSFCWLYPDEIPEQWLEEFPTGMEIIQKTIDIKDALGIKPDSRLVKRRQYEFEIFRSVEEAVELPFIKKGFANLDDFILKAQSILQRRKARSGRSLELHAKRIFLEEGLIENEDFTHQPESEKGKRPDFLFPSEKAYKSESYSSNRLKMLAVKTTCKDRWRQILNEADRIKIKHLLTLQEGVSENQFAEMVKAKVQLVVPTPIISSFPKNVRPHLQSFESFIGDVRSLSLR